MANRRDKHQAHKAAVSALGKSLSRRARSKCELCGESGRLDVVEVEGGPEEPTDEWALLLCTRCQDLSAQSPETVRFLETAMWAELLPAQILAVRTLRSIDMPWVTAALEGLWLDEATEALIG